MSQPLESLFAGPGAVLFRSSLTDLDDLPEALAAAGIECREVEMGMGSADNRELFYRLREHTGHASLPQVFIDGKFVGGLAETRVWLARHDRRGPAAARCLGYAGLLPFLLALVVILLSPDFGVRMMLAYAAVILSFVGAIHWGLALVQRDSGGLTFVASILPALLAWVALLVPPTAGLVMLSVGLLTWRVWEHVGRTPAVPFWFRRLRNHLTAGAVLALLAALLLFAAAGSPVTADYPEVSGSAVSSSNTA